jgi:glucosyl-dolichyl phosphate glucuronosyltransferase
MIESPLPLAAPLPSAVPLPPAPLPPAPLPPAPSLPGPSLPGPSLPDPVPLPAAPTKVGSLVDERVSVVIPSHSLKRWPLLRNAVESVRAQSPRPAEMVVVVDYNEELYQLARRELTGVTVLANRFARGVSGNRNTGAFHTTTPIVALLDDDARARPGWLASLLEPFDDATVVGTGAMAVADWESSRPLWFPDELLWTVGGSFADAPVTSAQIRNVWALAMAVRRVPFEAVGGFHPEFAKIGERSRPEDTDLCLRMSRAGGGRWIYVPGAVVDHVVPRERATMRYLISRCYDEGRGKVCMGRRHRGAVDLGPEWLYLRRTLPRAVGRGVAQTLTGHGLIGLARSASVLGAFAAAAIGGAVEAMHVGRMSGIRAPVAPTPARSD